MGKKNNKNKSKKNQNSSAKSTNSNGLKTDNSDLPDHTSSDQEIVQDNDKVQHQPEEEDSATKKQDELLGQTQPDVSLSEVDGGSGHEIDEIQIENGESEEILETELEENNSPIETPTSDEEKVNEDAASIKSTEALLETNESDLNDLVPQKQELSEYELNPDLETFLGACQHGDFEIVIDLISSGKVSANDTFSDNITGLHWAAINNRLSIVKYLIENEYSKADPNFLGGDLKASPLHWACRNGLVYIVDYLLTNSDADPSLRDNQSYNALHLSVHSSNIMLVLYILFACCDKSSKKMLYVDETDSSNRTSLHWAAYQGDIFTVNALLKFGADVAKVDNSLFIPIHWAFMKGYKSVLKSLVEAGSDIFVKNDKGKNTFDIAHDMKCYDVWVKVLKECDRDPKNNWGMKSKVLDPKVGKSITFLVPYVTLPLIFHICTFSEGFIIPKLFFSGIIFIGSIYLLNQLIVPTYIPGDKALPKSPLLAGIFSATAFWAIIVTLLSILPNMIVSHFIPTALLTISIGIFSWCFYKAMVINPGFVPTPTDNQIILGQIKELIRIGKLDTDNFCVNTYIRKPLRSKYSRMNNRLIARFDHYCPWIYNEVGVRNHKLFLMFVYALNLASVLFVYLSMQLFDKFEDDNESSKEWGECYFIPEEMCYGFKYHHFHSNLLAWIVLQGFWITLLTFTQTFQIYKGLTTWEFRLINHSIDRNINNHSTLPRDFITAPASHPTTINRMNNFRGMKVCSNLIGLDQFVSTMKLALASLCRRSTSVNLYENETLSDFEVPTDFGAKQNFIDFWFIGEVKFRNLFYLPIEGENNLNGKIVDYYKLYEYPSKHVGNENV